MTDEAGQKPVNRGLSHCVDSLLTDGYQITMAYAYWSSGRSEECAVFEAYYRKSPFGGTFVVVAGTHDVASFLASFKFTDEHISYIRGLYPLMDELFFTYLASVDCSEVIMSCFQEGELVFPSEPIIRIEGPLLVCQLLETGILNLINFPCLITTNAFRMRLAADALCGKFNIPPGNTNTIDAFDKVRTSSEITEPLKSIRLMEFGLRRAQGPDGAISASRYAFLGGFDSTSNLKAGMLFGIPVAGTVAHSFVTAYTEDWELESVPTPKMLGRWKELDYLSQNNGCDGLSSSYSRDLIRTSPKSCDNPNLTLVELVAQKHKIVCDLMGLSVPNCARGELISFTEFARSSPSTFIVVIDTYDTLLSGLPNFIAVAAVLRDLLGRKSQLGVRIDSGDIAYLSKRVRMWLQLIEKKLDLESFADDVDIIASGDINERVLISLSNQEHFITGFGIGTDLVTCRSQPALGGVYKLVSCNRVPRMKLSEQAEKQTIPFKKEVFRLFGKDGSPVLDLIQSCDEDIPIPGKPVMCKSLVEECKRCIVIPTRVKKMLGVTWVGSKVKNNEMSELEWTRNLHCSIAEKLPADRRYLLQNYKLFRADHFRYLNPTPYKVSITEEFSKNIKTLVEQKLSYRGVKVIS